MNYYGEDPITATIGPLAVDGLMVMATGALLATAPRPTTVGEVTAGATLATTTSRVTGTDPHLVQPTRTTRTARTGGAKATGTAAAIARLRQRHPDWTHAQLAAKAGVSVKTVSRHLSTPTDPGAVTGSTPAPARSDTPTHTASAVPGVGERAA
jgi:hypothetical protein